MSHRKAGFFNVETRRAVAFILRPLLALTIVDAYAAGFDCGRASSGIEKMVCADPEASRLDAELNDLFGRLRGARTELVKDQRAWIGASRDSCRNVDCLRQVYRARIAELTAIDACPVMSAGLSGAWVKTQGEGLEQMVLSNEGGRQTIVSWLHNRPELTGTWSLRNCMLTVRHGQNPALTFEFKVERVDRGRLLLKDMNEQTTASYARGEHRKHFSDRPPR